MELLANPNAATLSPVALFLQADWVVKGVMIGLILASIWTWAIIISFRFRIGGLRRNSDRFEAEYRKAADIDAFHRINGDSPLPIAKVFAAGVAEWRRSTGGKRIDREGTRQRLATAMGSATAAEVDRLSDRLNVLATIGAVAPFVGLFGTVWGIMRSFTSIAAEQNSSLVVVAPGIAEALLATALGLVAAIPAVLAYNKLSSQLNRYANRLETFSQEFGTIISRQLDEAA